MIPPIVLRLQMRPQVFCIGDDDTTVMSYETQDGHRVAPQLWLSAERAVLRR
jgi:hypothetical protein